MKPSGLCGNLLHLFAVQNEIQRPKPILGLDGNSIHIEIFLDFDRANTDPRDAKIGGWIFADPCHPDITDYQIADQLRRLDKILYVGVARLDLLIVHHLELAVLIGHIPSNLNLAEVHSF